MNSSPRREIKILHEDEQYVVFDKPSGMLVIPSPKKETNTLSHLANRQCVAKEGEAKLYPCHRIDRDTSGAIIFARGKKNQKLMMDLFREHAVEKVYTAFIHGRMEKPRGEFRKAIQNTSGRSKQRSSPAQTRYNVLQARKEFSVVEVMPVTGRTNQIRIHFAQAGHPLLGERKFAFARDYTLKFRRTALHAARLKWIHPISGREITVTSPLASDMSEFLKNNQRR